METQDKQPLDIQALRSSFSDVAVSEDDLSRLGDYGPFRRGDLLVDAAADGLLSRVLALLMLDTNPLAQRAGSTALHLAAAGDHVRVIELLLLAGVDIDIPDESLMTPLHRAAAHGAGHALELLIGRGATLEALDAQGRTPLALALDHGHAHLAQSLLQALEPQKETTTRDARRRSIDAHREPDPRTQDPMRSTKSDDQARPPLTIPGIALATRRGSRTQACWPRP